MCAVKAVRYRVILLLFGVKLQVKYYVVTALLTWLVDLLFEYFLDILEEEFLSNVIAYVTVCYSTEHWTGVLTSYFVVIERPFEVSELNLNHIWFTLLLFIMFNYLFSIQISLVQPKTLSKEFFSVATFEFWYLCHKKFHSFSPPYFKAVQYTMFDRSFGILN